MSELSRSTAVITGGTSGIGLATARAFMAKGFNVALNARTPRQEVVDELNGAGAASGARCILHSGDITLPQTSAELCALAGETFGGIDVVVHSAGGPAPGTILELTPELWQRAFSVHVDSAFHLFRAAHPYLAQGGGSVTFLSSAAALRGCPGTVAYQVVKASLIQLARALARDHADEDIRVNCVAPGIIRTPFQNGMTEQAKQNNLANRIPLHREGRPEDVASMIVQLAENAFVTGETVVIDGGMSMRMV